MKQNNSTKSDRGFIQSGISLVLAHGLLFLPGCQWHSVTQSIAISKKGSDEQGIVITKESSDRAVNLNEQNKKAMLAYKARVARNDAMREKFNSVAVGMSRQEVDKIMAGEAKTATDRSTVSYGDLPRTWSQQSPIKLDGKVVIRFDDFDKVRNKNFYEDYHGIPWEEGLIDSVDEWEQLGLLHNRKLRPEYENPGAMTKILTTTQK